MNYKGLKNPVANSKVKNPLLRKSKSSMQAQHAKILKTAGVNEPKSPLV